MKKILLLMMAAMLLMACSNSHQLKSPDGRLSVRFSLTDEGEPRYEVEKDGKAIIAASEMGFILDKGDFTRGFTLKDASLTSHDETWETTWGEEQFIRDHHNQLAVTLQHESGYLMRIVFRAFDDGLAFRYEWPENEGEQTEFTLLDEVTAFHFVNEPQAWSIPWTTEYYEALWSKEPISGQALRDTVCAPITLEWADQPIHYGFLHEAAIYDYPASNYYYADGAVRTYLTPWLNADRQRLADKAYLHCGSTTPWRMLILTETLPEMVASRIMLNLNEPCAIEDPSWCKPMKFIGIWWGMHLESMTWHQGPKHGATTANMKRYLEFAAEHGFGGVLAEGWNDGWQFWGTDHNDFKYDVPFDDYDIDFLAAHARSLGVQIVGHNETGGEAGDYEQHLDDAFAYAQKYGIHSIKTGYVSPIIATIDGRQLNKGQSGVRHYRKVIETAAKYQVCIDNHEPVMPSGIQRTYPNLFTQEGVRGQEWNAWSKDGGSPCEHVTVLPFTRIMAGPVDYTPGVFHFENPIIPGTRVHATLMNQLGLFVCFYSPLQMACDLPESYMEHPDAFTFIEHVPCDWKQSRLLSGVIGDYCVFARQDRNSDNWYVGGITDENPRSYSLQFDFLEPDATYSATIYCDAADADWNTNPYAYEIETMDVDCTTTLDLNMASGGGFAIELLKK